MNTLFETVKKYIKKLNKYWVTVIFFIVVIYFVGDYTIFKRISYNREINSLREEIANCQQKNKENIDKIEALKNDDEVLEKYAREELMMVKDKEEVFIIK